MCLMYGIHTLCLCKRVAVWGYSRCMAFCLFSMSLHEKKSSAPLEGSIDLGNEEGWGDFTWEKKEKSSLKQYQLTQG